MHGFHGSGAGIELYPRCQRAGFSGLFPERKDRNQKPNEKSAAYPRGGCAFLMREGIGAGKAGVVPAEQSKRGYGKPRGGQDTHRCRKCADVQKQKI